MRTMSKSALRVAREALAVGRAALPPYGSRYSRHDYTQPQLFALLVLKQFLRTDYRGLVALVAEWRDLRHALGLRKVPHYSTLAHAARRRGEAPGAAQAGLAEAHGRRPHPLAPDPGRGHRHRPDPGLARLRPGGAPGGRPARPGHGAGGRGLRRGAQPPPLPRGARRAPERHRAQPAQHRAALAEDALQARDAQALPARPVPSALARGERLQPVQAPPRLRPHRPQHRCPGARTRPAGPRPQPDAAQAARPRFSTEQAVEKAAAQPEWSRSMLRATAAV